MVLYGLHGITHGWAKSLTVISPEGTAAVLAHIDPGEDLIVNGGPGQLTHYLERRAGGFDRLIARYGIIVLDKPDWNARKAELGDAIWR